MNDPRLRYYRGRWPDENVPVGEPTWLIYEVDPVDDIVFRSIEVFADGHSERNSRELEQRDGFPCRSIVHAAFMPTVIEAGLEPVSFEYFEQLWSQSKDKPPLQL